ncbi:UDP-N-acetylmuramoylalanyl-D-glutamyl-2,6-diaminopimelate--D-alanyl-D-alanine ligase [Candidatus Raskinella chloraquaticus]|jgi:UDP-N-acetylmuramoyl-tripeptide--D-alanyl-D-alanine ligase|uniref:UDP-N-acetylmuramoyl-tripeptide--D-alanyl-D-alanine ligase n=1 Tax=Candidatus Raskinella chloraquaticus TaxID=1951219 RepID=A0A1W9HXT7_9HYPH|nr:MAG: UDP-N-acetylmuramoylalanyl-D-glutamyl-2, 6-diaminopimelate--D-alanyl-D-alanine ligase [Proteobacteria bacterium SG_bin8]
MSRLWTMDEIAAATGGRLAGGPFASVGGFSIDTRSLKPGDVFVALTGERNDGHAYVEAALSAGAVAAIIAEDKLPGLAMAGRYLIVDEPLAALYRLAAASRARSAARIAAVTGSVGKTGTKEALRSVLAPSGPTHAALASFNNHIGVPLTLSSMPATSTYGVFEIGMNHAGEITPLTQLVRPHVAIVTTVEAAHLEYFSSVEEIAEAKAEIFAGLEPGGAALINRDNAFHDVLAQRASARGARVILFGEHPAADVRLVDVRDGADGSLVTASVLGTQMTYRIGMPGRHVVQNSLAVLGAVSVLGGDLALAGVAYARLRAPRGRGECLTFALPQGGSFMLIDESYNANPASMAAAFAVLGASRPGAGGRRIAILGDMLELGAAAKDLHEALASPLLAAQVDLVFTAGPLMEALHHHLPSANRGGHASSAADIEAAVIALPRAGDVIMVKGSNGSRVAAIVAAFKTRYALAGQDNGADKA